MKLSIVVLSFALISMALLASCNSGSGASADLGSSSSSVGSSSQSSFLGVGITEAEFNALDRVSCEVYYIQNPDSLLVCIPREMATDSARVVAGEGCPEIVHDDSGNASQTIRQRLTLSCSAGAIASCQNTSFSFLLYNLPAGEPLPAGCTLNNP